MCLIVASERKIATEDMVVYKILVNLEFNEFHTPYQNFTIELGKTYKSRLIKTKDTKYNAEIDSCEKIDVVKIGLHSYTNKKTAEMYVTKYKYLRIAKCIIPKGSHYYLGEKDEIASTRLKYIEIV